MSSGNSGVICVSYVQKFCLTVVIIAASALIWLKADSNHLIYLLNLSSSVSSTDSFQHLELLLQKTKEAKLAIHNQWDVDHFPLFLSFMDIPQSSWEIQKFKFVQMLVSRENGANDVEFVVGFSGSSVTASHDNFFHEGFPSIFNTTMRHVFEIAGIALTVRNHALGNNPCCPYDNCIETHLGDDLDLVMWEQSMNCGRDPRPLETFLRAAARMSKMPTVWFLASGTPYWSSQDCVSGNATSLNLVEGKGWTETRVSANRTIPGTTLMEKELLAGAKSGQLGAIAATQQHLDSFTFLQIKTSTPGKLLMLHNIYSALAPAGQNIQLLDQYRCMGPYGADFSVKTPGGGQKWHPGRAGHRLRGENLAYFLLHIFEEAISMVLDLGIEQAGKESLQRLAGLREGARKPPSKPVVCNPEECDSRPSCFTNFEPRIKNSLSDIIIAPQSLQSASNWTYDLSMFDKAAVLKAAQRGLGYLDRKYVYTSGTMHKPMSLHISPKRENSFVLICEVQKGFNTYPAWMADLDKGAHLTLYENVIDAVGNKMHWASSSLPVADNGTNAAVGKKIKAQVTHLVLKHYSDQCYKTESVIKPGNHVLGIAQKHNGLRINIAYVVYW